MFIILCFIFLCSGGGSNFGLDEVVLHEALEVEVGKLVLLAKLEELGKLGIRVDLAAIGLVLKTIGLDVGVELLAHVSASHLSANGLAKEGGKLVTDAGGLDETRRLAIDVVAALLGRGLLGSLHLTGNGLLKGLEVVLEGGKETNKLLELGTVLGHLDGKTREGSVSGGNLNSGLRGRSNLRSRRLGSSSNLLGAGGLATGAEAEASTLGTGAVAGVADLEALTILAIIRYITTSFLNHFHNKLINRKSILLWLGYWS